MIAAYVRVSSRSQDGATQTSAIKQAAKARRETVKLWYSEKARATKMNRPELVRLMNDARRGRFNRLYVFRLDRLSRTGIRDMLTVINELQTLGVEVRTIADGFSLQGPTADLIIAMVAWAAEMERLALGERISSARARVEASGGHWGRRRAVGATTEQKILKLRNKQKMTIREIVEVVGIPRATVARVLSQKGPYGRTAKTANKGVAKRVSQ